MRILSPNEMFAEYQRRQLRPGNKLETMTRPMIDHINSLLQWHDLSTGQTCTRPSSEKSLSLSLIEWTTYTFIHSITKVYWGSKIFESDPSLLQTYKTWERTYWKYIFQLPRCFSRDMYQARDKLVNAFTAYFRLPQAERADVAWFTPIAEAEMRDIGLDDQDLGRAHMLQHWAYVSHTISLLDMPQRQPNQSLNHLLCCPEKLTPCLSVNGNMHKVSFWIMAYLLHAPPLLEAIRDETARGITDDTPDIPYLVENCPRLEAIFHEVLRIYTSNSLMRHVTATTRLGGKVLQKGRNVMVPYRLLHYDQSVWGDDVSTFDPERFLRSKELARGPSFKPFGGGQHLCPGRFLAKQAIFAFVALALSRFDVCLDGDGGGDDGSFKQAFPHPGNLKPGLATLGPREGDDVFVCCRLRAKD